MMKALSAFGVLLVVLGSSPAPGAAQEALPVGMIVAQRGVVTALREAGPVALFVGAPVRVRDRIVTAADARARIEFADGSTLALGAATKVDIEDYALGPGQTRLATVLSLLQGIVRTVVGPGAPGARFDITTPAAIASVRSTDWIADVGPDGTAVFVFEGAVAVTGRAAGAAVLIEPAFGTDVPDGTAPRPPARWGQGRVDGVIARTALP